MTRERKFLLLLLLLSQDKCTIRYGPVRFRDIFFFYVYKKRKTKKVLKAHESVGNSNAKIRYLLFVVVVIVHNEMISIDEMTIKQTGNYAGDS